MGRAGELQKRMGEGQILGQLGILSGRPARHEARAEEDTLIYFIPAGVFESLLDSNADFADHVEIEERQRLRQAVERGTGKHPLLTLKAGRSEERRVGKEWRGRWRAEEEEGKGRRVQGARTRE